MSAGRNGRKRIGSIETWTRILFENNLEFIVIAAVLSLIKILLFR